jgi:hypothetical protein
VVSILLIIQYDLAVSENRVVKKYKKIREDVAGRYKISVHAYILYTPMYKYWS